MIVSVLLNDIGESKPEESLDAPVPASPADADRDWEASLAVLDLAVEAPQPPAELSSAWGAASPPRMAATRASTHSASSTY